MSKKHLGIYALLFGLGLPGLVLFGCGDKGSTEEEDTGMDESESGDGDGDGDACQGHPIGEGAADGDACTDNEDCASNICVQYQDAPADSEATCAAPPDECLTRVTGTVRDFQTGEAVAAVDVRIVGAVGAASNPEGAKNLALGQSGADGRFDVTTDERVDQPLGIVAAVEGANHFLTATGLAEPEEGNFYGPGTTIHDVWAVPTTMLEDWSALLDGDEEFAGLLPLGTLGGVVGMVRDGTTGEAVAGITIVPQDPDTSKAVIRYLNEAQDGFDGTETATHGLFVIVDPGLGENFDAEMGGEKLPDLQGTAGSASGAIFTLIMDI